MIEKIAGFIFGSLWGFIFSVAGYIVLAIVLLTLIMGMFGEGTTITQFFAVLLCAIPILFVAYFPITNIIDSYKKDIRSRPDYNPHPNQSPSKSFIRRYNYNNYTENWPELRQAALERDGYKCGNCDSSQNLMVHHIVPLSKGGSNQLSNLRTLCENCHKKLHPYMK